jgi:hypothetical protein
VREPLPLIRAPHPALRADRSNGKR